jgi:hypothetical protein
MMNIYRARLESWIYHFFNIIIIIIANNVSLYSPPNVVITMVLPLNCQYWFIAWDYIAKNQQVNGFQHVHMRDSMGRSIQHTVREVVLSFGVYGCGCHSDGK